MATATLNKPRSASRTTVALKMLMAVTGALLVLFLLAHMYGNLKMFAGEDPFNDYAAHLRELGEPMLPYSGFLWIFRVTLLAAIVGHIYSAATLWKRANKARGSRYQVKKPVQQTYASRTMRWGGIIIFFFIIYHLLHFTTHSLDVDHKDGAYQMVLDGFSNPLAVVFYTIAVIMVGFHLRHGIWSATQTLGFTSQSNRSAVNLIATLIAAVVVLGFLSVPFGVLLGVLN